MTTRAANFVDIPHVARLYAEAHARSVYAGTGFDLIEAKQLFARALNRHGHMNIGGSLFLVSEADGEVRGFMIGILDPVYPCVKALMATDLLFVMGEGADPADARQMIRRLIAWAEANPKVVEVHLGVTNAIVDWQRTAKFYARLGLEQCGAMFRRGFDRSQKEVRHVQNC
jgi:hypothetical protein